MRRKYRDEESETSRHSPREPLVEVEATHDFHLVSGVPGAPGADENNLDWLATAA